MSRGEKLKCNVCETEVWVPTTNQGEYGRPIDTWVHIEWLGQTYARAGKWDVCSLACYTALADTINQREQWVLEARAERERQKQVTAALARQYDEQEAKRKATA